MDNNPPITKPQTDLFTLSADAEAKLRAMGESSGAAAKEAARREMQV